MKKLLSFISLLLIITMIITSLASCEIQDNLPDNQDAATATPGDKNEQNQPSNTDNTDFPKDPEGPNEPDTFVPIVKGPFKGEINIPGKSIYALSTSGSESYYLNVTETKEDGIDIYTETVENTNNGVYIYFKINDTKLYIDVYEERVGTGRIKLSSTPSVHYIYNDNLTTYICNIGDNSYYLGTYTNPSGITYESLSCSNTSYITGNNASKLNVTQFPLQLITYTSPSQNPPVDPTECTSHKDADDNGYCDDCYTSVIVILDIFAINDLHGKLLDSDTQPGADELTTYLKTEMGKNDNSFILSSGDMWQGSTESNATNGKMMIEWMNELNFVSMTMGNHEFDWGEEAIESNLALAEFPFLAINIYEKDTGLPAPYCQASTVVEYDGVQIGIIGAIGDCLSSISGEQSQNLIFKTGSELSSLIKAESARLRAEEGVDFVILSIHADKSEYDSALSNGYIDLVFEGHSHDDYTYSDRYGVYHLQNGGDNAAIARAAVSINSITGTSRITATLIVSSGVYDDYAKDPLINDLMEDYDSILGPLFETIATLPNTMTPSQIKSLTAELYYKKGVEYWKNEYTITLGGGYISARSPYKFYAGDLTYADVYSVMPFDNQLVLCSIKGSDLYNKFIHSSNSNYFIYGDDYSNIDMEATYYIITDTYSSTYTQNNLTEIERYPEGIYARDLLAEYLEEKYPA